MRKTVLRELVLSVIFMSIVGFSEKASGYEFSMTGIMTWKYASYSQLGSKGFFGPFDTDASGAGPDGYGGSIGGAASMNGWLGHEMQSMPTLSGYGEISSGSDLALATIYMTIYPELRLTEALRIRGSYRIGSWETPYNPTSPGTMVRSEYPEGMAPGVLRSFSPGYWETLWASLQTPWGIVVFGKRPGPFGTGLIFDGNDNADAAGIMLMTNYGPFRVGINAAPWLLGSPYYYTLSDKNAIRQFDLGAGMTYDSGPISSGLGGRIWKLHTGPESATFQGENAAPPTGRYAVIPTDTVITDGTVYFKYFNGRFFFNAEAAWGYEITKRQRWLASDSGISEGKSRFAPNYVEHWRTAVETGALIGPSKISFIWSYIPGFDRRHGVRIDRQPYPPLNIATGLTNVSLFRPYSLLLSYTYGSGNNSITPDSRHGYMTDANIFGMRLDYAIAANLNIFGTAFTANRISCGYGQGYIRPAYLTSLTPTVTPSRFTGRVQFVESDNYNNPAPSIPDSGLGYEFDWGFGWKLMDKYTLNGTFAVWKPGGWFNYACVDRSVSNWKNPDVSNNFGVGPGKVIDPVFGMEIKIEVEY
jgi:hypothetical protein